VETKGPTLEEIAALLDGDQANDAENGRRFIKRPRLRRHDAKLGCFCLLHLPAQDR
jgi:hypothetical protein